MSFCEAIITLLVRHVNIRYCQHSLVSMLTVVIALFVVVFFAECKFYTERARGKLVFWNRKVDIE